jgi:hypothetical protein
MRLGLENFARTLDVVVKIVVVVVFAIKDVIFGSRPAHPHPVNNIPTTIQGMWLLVGAVQIQILHYHTGL